MARVKKRTFIQLLIKHKERVTLVTLSVTLAIILIYGYFRPVEPDKHEQSRVEKPKSVVKLNLNSNPSKNSNQPPSNVNSTSFFMKPGPGELLEKLSEMENLNEKVIEKKLLNLPVIWPTYLFSIEEKENNMAEITLDVSEDGFGIVIKTNVERTELAPLLGADQGEKVWIAGEIVGVDPSGTGTIYIKGEHLSLGEDPPFRDLAPGQ